MQRLNENAVLSHHCPVGVLCGRRTLENDTTLCRQLELTPIWLKSQGLVIENLLLLEYLFNVINTAVS